MKLSYTVATPDVQDEKILCLRGDLHNNFHELSKIGYHGIELMVRDVKLLNAGEIKNLAAETQLEIAAVSTGQLTFEETLTISSLDREICRQAVTRTREIIDFTRALDCKIVNIGTLRGNLPQEEEARKEAHFHAAESMHEILAYAADCNIVIAFEPQCRYVVNWHNTLADTTEWMEQFNREHFKLLWDIYHTMVEETSIIASLIRYKSEIAHIQFSDSNRLSPGQGQINFAEIVRVLRALHYQGFISVEIRQHPDGLTAARQAAAHLLPYFNENIW